MKAIIEAISPSGYKVKFEVETLTPGPSPIRGEGGSLRGEGGGLEALLKRLADVELGLAEAGYEPTGELPRTADGLPICRKHQMAMKQRQKQGDEWFSHVVVLADGREFYCKGRPGVDSPGWAY